MQKAYEKYTTKRGLRRFLRFISTIVKLLLMTFILFMGVSTFLLSSYRVESFSMEPTLHEGDRILASPLVFGAKFPLTSRRLPGFKTPERGDLVVLQPPFSKRKSFIVSIVEPVMHLFSRSDESYLQNGNMKTFDGCMVKRVIGIPGDTVKVEDFIVAIKPSGSSTFYKEQVIIETEYDLIVDFAPRGWQKGLPFSGNLDELFLKEDEYFVVGDNRTGSSDSRSWGPLAFSHIIGKVIFHYWPFSRLGKI